jgi:hypothetical protein
MESMMRNKLKIALGEFDKRTRNNPEAMFGFVSLCMALPILFIFLFGPLFARYFSPEFLSEYFKAFFFLTLVPTAVIGSFFLNRVLNISKDIRIKKSQDMLKLNEYTQKDDSKEV